MSAITDRLAPINLDSAFYADPEIHAQEKDKIFRRSWQLIGGASQLSKAGAYLATTMAGVGIVIRRGSDGVLHGFQNVCPHRGARLVPDGLAACERLACPYHGWVFDDEGKLTDTPWYGEASPFDLSSQSLDPIAVSVWRGLLFAAIEPETTLEEQLGDLPGVAAAAPMERFAWYTQRRFTADVNWKAYLDQFNEFYHVPTVHAPDKGVAIDRYDAYPLRGMMRMDAPKGEGENAAYYGGIWLWGWPNWTLSFFPGGMKASRVNPVSATSCEVDFHYFFEDMAPEGEPMRRKVVDATDAIFAEDAAAAGLAQANYSSGAYRPGPLHPRLERAVAYFQARVRRALDGVTDADVYL